MGIDTAVGYAEEKKRKFITAKVFFGIVTAVAGASFINTSLRRLEFDRWENGGSIPYGFQLVRSGLNCHQFPRWLLRKTKRQAWLFRVGHLIADIFYKIIITHGVISAVYFLAVLIAGHRVGLRKRTEEQGSTFVFGSIPVGLLLSVIGYLLKTRNHYILKSFRILLNDNTRLNLISLIERIIAAGPKAFVPAIYIAILVESYKYGETNDLDLILAGVTPLLFSIMGMIPLAMNELYGYRNPDALNREKIEKVPVIVGGKQYTVGHEACIIVNNILGRCNQSFDNHSLRLSYTDRKVIEIAKLQILDEKREQKSGLSMKKYNDYGSFRNPSTMWGGSNSANNDFSDTDLYPDEGEIEPVKGRCTLF